MNIYLILIISFIAGEFVLQLITEINNINAAKTDLPDEFVGLYNPVDYGKTQEYLGEKTWFSLLESGIYKAILIILILSGGFNYIDLWIRKMISSEILSGVIFIGILVFASSLIGLPFTVYNIFHIEEKYGFNKTTYKIFISDLLKTWVIAAFIGGIVLAVVMWFFIFAGKYAWLYCWSFITVFQLFMVFVSPVLILPLFNKYEPLEEGELKSAIKKYSDDQEFKLKGIYKMDGSKRSLKSNAFFTGLGKSKRISLFDTLIEKLDSQEIVSVLAHEIGHYKGKHILKRMVFMACRTFVILIIFSLFKDNHKIISAIGMKYASIYSSMLVFSLFFSPISIIMSLVTNTFSRRDEYYADKYAIKSYGKPEVFIKALKKITVSNMNNLTPHPVKVAFDYSHPPIIERLRRIKDYTDDNKCQQKD